MLLRTHDIEREVVRHGMGLGDEEMRRLAIAMRLGEYTSTPVQRLLAPLGVPADSDLVRLFRAQVLNYAEKRHL